MMGPRDFAVAVREECDTLLSTVTDPTGGSRVAAHLAAADLSSTQQTEVLAALGAAMSDALYTLLLALDGSASLGAQQQIFRLEDGEGTIIANGNGALEAAAWEAFHRSGN